MTPERWRQVGELFEASVRIDPSGREPWLRVACGDDDDSRAEVGRLLVLDERADRVGFLTPSEATGPPPDPTASWPARVEALSPVPAGHRVRAGRRHRRVSPAAGAPAAACGATHDLRAPRRRGRGVHAADCLPPHPGGCVPLETRNSGPGDPAYYLMNHDGRPGPCRSSSPCFGAAPIPLAGSRRELAWSACSLACLPGCSTG